MSLPLRPRQTHEGVSRKMLVAIVAMLAVIIVPAAAFTVESCRLVIKVTNMDSETVVTCEVSIYAHGFGISMVDVDPGEERTWTYPLRPGSYSFHVYYWFSDLNYSAQSYYETFSVLPFETERYDFEAEKWY